MFKEQYQIVLDYMNDINLAPDPKEKLGDRPFLGMNK
jgi:hypothetical protein